MVIPEHPSFSFPFPFLGTLADAFLASLSFALCRVTVPATRCVCYQASGRGVLALGLAQENVLS